MRKKRKLGRAFSLSALSVLGLMAVFAVSAQATAGKFQIAEKDVGALSATAAGAQEGSASLLVPGRSLTITCQKSSKHILIKITITISFEATISECVPSSHPGGGALSACTVGKEKGKPESIIAKGSILPFLHEAKNYVTAEPETEGGNFTEVTISGSTCAIKGTYPVTGSVSAEVTTNNAVVDLLKSSSAFSELVKDTLKFGVFAATLSESSTIELTGAHKGLKFGVV